MMDSKEIADLSKEKAHGFGYDPYAFHPLETCAAKRTNKEEFLYYPEYSSYLLIILQYFFMEN